MRALWKRSWFVALALAACSPGNPGPNDGGGGNPAIQCATYTDNTAFAGADIHFRTDAAVEQYSPNCVRIKKGSSVGWFGSFTEHPLMGNGEAGTPITHVSSGTESGRISFPSEGTFGFYCHHHPSQMWGAVSVVP